MCMDIRLISTNDDELMTVATWSLTEWGEDFPDDTIASYRALFAEASDDRDRLPVVLVAVDNGLLVGTASLVADDELPDATEIGPWLAATYVVPHARMSGVGAHLVAAVENEARRLGFAELFLYTHDRHEWYERRGWQRLRATTLRTRPVIVMCKDLRD